MSAEVPPLDCISQLAREKLQVMLREITATTCEHLSKVGISHLLSAQKEQQEQTVLKPTGME
jgi:hypothetical protein